MLAELHIRNFALIDHADLEFGAGLNILTGETGAGKSILIDALGLALGERAGGDLVRTGCERALVEAVFDIAGASDATKAAITDAGLDSEDDPGQFLVSREVSRAGKSQCRVNGRLTPVATLRHICDSLIDIHGQHEHQSLLAADKHVDLLDTWLGSKTLALRAQVAETYSALNALRREIEALRTEARERARNLDLYRFQQSEITDANLRADEEDELSIERPRLANAEKLFSASSDAYEALGDAALDPLNAALSSIRRAESLDETLAPIHEQLIEAVSAAEDARSALRHYRDAIEFNPERLEEIESRLNLLSTLKRKYGDTIADVIAYSDEISGKLDGLENQDAREADLAAQICAAEKRLHALTADLTASRTQGSAVFAEGILRELADLGMAATKFEVAIEPQAITSRGADRVEFMLSPNPGEPLRPLAKTASGGELSRVMLAMKSVLARTSFIPTMIFDEIDVGIGGRTGGVIAQKLAALSNLAQIMCITHLPQIASRPASAHFAIEKQVEGDRTVVRVTRLDADQRVDEIARMLGGATESGTVRKHASEMLQAV